MNKRKLILQNSEAHLASLCVAIVSGGIGGLLAYLIGFNKPLWHGLIGAALLGFLISWLVCKYLFSSAHHWYNPKSLYHRVYDSVGVVSGVLIYYFVGL